MPHKNTIADVFKYINMNNGDTKACWEWKGKVNDKDGRPYFTVDGQRSPSYAYALEAFKGKKPTKDSVARHDCDLYGVSREAISAINTGRSRSYVDKQESADVITEE